MTAGYINYQFIVADPDMIGIEKSIPDFITLSDINDSWDSFRSRIKAVDTILSKSGMKTKFLCHNTFDGFEQVEFAIPTPDEMSQEEIFDIMAEFELILMDSDYGSELILGEIEDRLLDDYGELYDLFWGDWKN